MVLKEERWTTRRKFDHHQVLYEANSRRQISKKGIERGGLENGQSLVTPLSHLLHHCSLAFNLKSPSDVAFVCF